MQVPMSSDGGNALVVPQGFVNNNQFVRNDIVVQNEVYVQNNLTQTSQMAEEFAANTLNHCNQIVQEVHDEANYVVEMIQTDASDAMQNSNYQTAVARNACK